MTQVLAVLSVSMLGKELRKTVHTSKLYPFLSHSISYLQDCISRGWVDIRDTHHLHRVFQVGGCRWFADQVVDLLLSQFYQNDIMMTTSLLSSWFCLRREALTACLVGETIPALLHRGKSAFDGPAHNSSASDSAPTIQNPHAFALARLTVLCLVATLVGKCYFEVR